MNHHVNERVGRGTIMRAVVAALAIQATTGCAYQHTAPLAKYDLSKGYRFDSLPMSRVTPARNSDGLFVVLAFSGGGTRAAAMSYGALAQLKAVKIHVDSAGRPVSCVPDTPQCRGSERSLLDEVDVITSVSGGSFTSAYYALYGDSIFNRQSTFQDRFLYHRLQSDLVKQMFYHPRNWKFLRSRIEIAADYHARNIFGNATFADLQKRSRPYLVLNATDASTGSRFEFSQEQFDLLCADLSKTPVARGVASSSAFPVLLNSLTVDTHTGNGGCGYHVPTWETNAMNDKLLNPERYRRALQQRAFRDSTRRYLHLLDGGLADNVGLRGIIARLEAIDMPDDTLPDGSVITGGWNIWQRMDREQIKHLVVITVDSRSYPPKDWDTKAAGPGIISVVNTAASVPMGNFTTESIELMRSLFRRNRADNIDSVKFTAMSISLDGVPDDGERALLNNAGTNFELPQFFVDCLVSRSAAMVRDGQVFDENAKPKSFAKFIQEELNGTIGNASVPAPASCTEADAKKAVKGNSHTIDVALRYSISRPYRNDIEQREGFGLTLRVAKPNGLGASVAFTMPSFGIPATIGNTTFTLGRMRLYGLLAGPVLSRQIGPVEVSGALGGGYAFANFRTSGAARTAFAANGVADMSARSTSTWLAKPSVSLWYSLTGKIATMVSASYLMARPDIEFKGQNPLPRRALHVNALQWSAGLGYRIF